MKNMKDRKVMIMEQIIRELKENGYDYAVAIATEAEINAKAACGQLAIICEIEKGDTES